MKIKKYLSLVLAIIFIVVFTVACSSNQPSTTGEVSNTNNKSDFEPVTLRFGNQHPSDSMASKADQEICDEIEKATEGRVKIKLYTDSSLGDYINIFEEVMLGTIEMAHITAVETYDPRMSGSMLPYLGSNYDELAIAYNPDNYLYKTVFESAQGLGLRTFGFFCEGFNGVGVNKELTDSSVPNKDKGVLARVPGLDIFTLSSNELGFRTSNIAYSDTYTSIQTGVVDGWIAGPPNLNYLYFRDVIDYYYHYMMNQEATQIFMNEKVFQKLLPEDQKAITEIIQNKCKESIELAKEDDDKYMKMMEEEGIEIITFTEEERAVFADTVRKNVWPKLAKNVSQEFVDNILKSIQE